MARVAEAGGSALYALTEANLSALNATMNMAGKAAFTLASAATGVVEFMANGSNLCPHTVRLNFKKKSICFALDKDKMLAQSVELPS